MPQQMLVGRQLKPRSNFSLCRAVPALVSLDLGGWASQLSAVAQCFSGRSAITDIADSSCQHMLVGRALQPRSKYGLSCPGPALHCCACQQMAGLSAAHFRSSTHVSSGRLLGGLLPGRHSHQQKGTDASSHDSLPQKISNVVCMYMV